MGIQGISDFGGVSNRINQIIKELAEVNAIVRDIYRKLDEFKAEMDKNIVREVIKKARDRIAALKTQVDTIAPRLKKAVAQIELEIEDLRRKLSLA